MFRLIFSSKFDKDLKICKKRNYSIAQIVEVLELLKTNGIVPAKNKPHKLSGIYNQCWECHIRPDWLLIWKIDRIENKIELVRTGTHSDLF